MLELVGDIVGWLIVAGIVTVSGWVAQRVVRSLFRGPVRHALIRVVEDGKEITGVRGLIDGPATVRAPLTGEPCALATTSITSSAQLWPVWQSTAVGDLRVRYDFEIRNRPRKVTRRPGTLTVRADQIVVDRPVGRRTTFPVDTAVLDRLSAAGLPAAVRARIEADPGSVQIAETVLAPDELIHLATQPTPNPPPDPPFHLSPDPRAFMAAGTHILTCLVVAGLLFGLLCAGSVAYVLIVG